MARERFHQITFHELPTDEQVFFNLTDSMLNLPEKVCALFVIALRIYAVDPELGMEMICFLRNEEKLEENEIKNMLKEPLKKSAYIPLSYFKGAVPENSYTPEMPYVITVKEVGRRPRFRKEMTMYVGCPGAGVYRPVSLVKKKRRKINKKLLGDPWFISDYSSLVLPVPEPMQKVLDENSKAIM